MAVKAFEVYGQLVFDADKAKKDLKEWEQGLVSAGKKMEKFGKNMSKFVTLPVLAAAGASVKLASDYGESLNKIDVAFGDSQDSVLEWSKTTANSIGVSSGAALDMIATMGDMGTSMGLTQKASADMGKELVARAGDLASFKNIRLDVAETALKGIYTGETESLKTLGVVMTQANLELFALEKGLGKTLKEMDQAEKVQLRYQYVMEATNNSANDFANTLEGSLANQLRSTRAHLENTAVALGQKLLPLVTPIVTRIAEFAEKLSELDDEQLKMILTVGGVVAAIGPLNIVIGKTLKNFKLLSTVAKGLFSPAGLMVAAVAIVAAFAMKLTMSEKALDLEKQSLDRRKAAMEEVNTVQKTANEYLQTYIELTGRAAQQEKARLQGEIAGARNRNLEIAKTLISLDDIFDKNLGGLELIQEIGANEKVRAAILREIPNFMQMSGREQVKAIGLLKDNLSLSKQENTAIVENGRARIAAIDQLQSQINKQKEIKTTTEETTIAIEEEGEAIADIDPIYEALLAKQEANNLTYAEGYASVMDEINSKSEESAALRIAHNNAVKENADETLEATIEKYKALATTISGSVAPILESFGEALIKGGDAWKALGNAALQSIARIVRGLGEQAVIQAAIQFALPLGVGIPSGGRYIAAAAAAFIASGVISALASYSDGGVVPGDSYGGDNKLARVNSGERILTAQQNAAYENFQRQQNTVSYNTTNNYGGDSNIENNIYLGDQLYKFINEGIDNKKIKAVGWT